MKQNIKYFIKFTLAITGILLLSGCVGEYDNIIEYFRAAWRWWNVLFVILVVILFLFLILLVRAMIRYKPKE
ncbi:MAG: hypothetical protein FWE36_04725 [Erysipelotrichales bacterium]|nr:hypothetical protein [Erysipelotrichales bacterium]